MVETFSFWHMGTVGWIVCADKDLVFTATMYECMGSGYICLIIAAQSVITTFTGKEIDPARRQPFNFLLSE